MLKWFKKEKSQEPYGMCMVKFGYCRFCGPCSECPDLSDNEKEQFKKEEVEGL